MYYWLADLVLGKSRYFFKPNILNATGSLIITDPKGELLRDCGYSLKKKGYTIKVLNLDEKSHSNYYNPIVYIREWREDDVMTFINTLIANTKSEFIENISRRSFLGEGRNTFSTINILLCYKTL